MATYVMSDIHGQYSLFERMLDKIKFSDTDDLYILGDIIDRGPENIKMIEKVFSNSNAISADVDAGFDPTYPSYYDLRNSCKLGHGVCMCKYTGARRKKWSK